MKTTYVIKNTNDNRFMLVDRIGYEPNCGGEKLIECFKTYEEAKKIGQIYARTIKTELIDETTCH